MTATQAPTPGPLSGDDVKLLVKLLDTLKPFAEVAEKLKHCHVVEICEPTPDNPSRNIIPMPREWFERAGDDLEYIAIQLHASGVLSEGQASKITGLDRVSVRREVDRLAPTAPVEASGSERERLISVMRDHIALGEIGSCSAEIVGHEEAADAILALRPQPSGETREAGWISDDDMRSLLECKDVGQGRAKLQLILNALSARPLALGGQQRVDEDWIRGLIGEAIVMNEDQERADEGDEELSRISDGVLKALRPHLSTTPARAEAQDEGAAGERDKRAWIDRWNAIEGAAQDALHTMTELLEAPNLKRMQYALGERRDALASALSLPEAGTAWMRPAHPYPTPAAEPRKVSALPVDGEAIEQVTGLTVAEALDDPVSSVEIMRALTTSRTLCVWADGTYRVMPTMDVPVVRNEEGTLIAVIPIAEIGEIATPTADADRARIAVEALEPFARVARWARLCGMPDLEKATAKYAKRNLFWDQFSAADAALNGGADHAG